jgi:hypothetical protein
MLGNRRCVRRVTVPQLCEADYLNEPSPGLPRTCHSIDFPYNLAILSRIVALGSFSPRLMAEM